MNRRELAAEIVRLEGLAAAAKARAAGHRAELEADACRELEEQGTAPTWRLPGLGTVLLSTSREAPVVADPGAGEIVPGLLVRPGGMPGRLVLRPAPGVREAAQAAAEADLAGLALLASETPGHLAPSEVDR